MFAILSSGAASVEDRKFGVRINGEVGERFSGGHSERRGERCGVREVVKLQRGNIKLKQNKFC